MNIRLRLTRLFAVTATTGMLLTACGGSGGHPSTSGSPSAVPGTSPAPSPTPTAPVTPGTPAPTTSAPDGGTPPLGSALLQPVWPFTTLAQAQAWERDFRSDGHQPWHLDPVQTALSFTQGYLGFQDVGRVSSPTVSGRDARIGVGLSVPEGAEGARGTVAVIHLVRYGNGPDAPWEVVGTDDTTLSLTTPAYGSVVHSPVLTGGRITGVDESIRVQVRQPSSTAPLGTACCTTAGGSAQPWNASVSFTGAHDPVLTIVAFTGGHLSEVERFTVTAVRTG
ncbi:hypothetical protein J7E97_13775 [Streptomyces sp. ISL-66]|uniref:hypothetical protein n=1 Tax=Streptomyces sp. ISL-66 TaxID=2819186 RepID=UPI001BE859B7|nr:hypothetical protein [Streptomyces sp. ISL-66]MBT2468914.1 hypothetical protein [Streptomyces sp. ISL-66]